MCYFFKLPHASYDNKKNFNKKSFIQVAIQKQNFVQFLFQFEKNFVWLVTYTLMNDESIKYYTIYVSCGEILPSSVSSHSSLRVKKIMLNLHTF